MYDFDVTADGLVVAPGRTVIIVRDLSERATIVTSDEKMGRRLELHPDAIEYDDAPPRCRKFKIPGSRVSFRPPRQSDWQAMREHGRVERNK